MATYLPQEIWGDGPNISDADRDKYFDREDNGSHDPRYTLKEGYESRSLGKGEKPSKSNSLATYTNDFDSLHDEYDANSDRENYGIFKTYARPEATDPESPTEQTSETAIKTSSTAPAVDGAHLAEAKERVQAWEHKSQSGDRAQETFGQGTQKQDYDFTNEKFLKSSQSSHPSTSPVSQFSSANH